MRRSTTVRPIAGDDRPRQQQHGARANASGVIQRRPDNRREVGQCGGCAQRIGQQLVHRQILHMSRLPRHRAERVAGRAIDQQQRGNAEAPAPRHLDQRQQRTLPHPRQVCDKALCRPLQRVALLGCGGHQTFTTRFTSLPGTAMIFTTVLPARRAATFSSACAAALISSRSASAAQDLDHVHQLAIYLHRDLDLVLARKLRIGNGPGLAEDHAFMPEFSSTTPARGRARTAQASASACGRLRAASSA